jgi:hypothetical protein
MQINPSTRFTSAKDREWSNRLPGNYDADMLKRWIMGLIVVMALAGCTSPSHPTSSTPRPGEPNDADAAAAQRLARDIQRAPTALDEADALKRLQRWAADHKFTYDTRSVRAGGVEVIEHPTAAPFPIITQVTIYRGQQPFYNFTFTPRDNRNLALIGASL